MSQLPDDLIELGKVQDAYGLKGWVSIVPASSTPEVLLRAKTWWVSRLREGYPSGASSRVNARYSSRPTQTDLIFTEVDVLACKAHGSKLVAHLMGFEDRTRAEALKGARVFVSRAKFPSPEQGEFYWVDLIGCDVVNLQGQALGKVSQVTDHGAHAIIEVGKHLIPFVEVYVPNVSLSERLITVDWQEDYS